MTTIRREHLVQSVTDLQFISYYHPADYIRALGAPTAREQSPAARRDRPDPHQFAHVRRRPPDLPGHGHR